MIFLYGLHKKNLFQVNLFKELKNSHTSINIPHLHSLSLSLCAFAGDIANENYTSYANECQVFKAHIPNNEESAIITHFKCDKVQIFSCQQCHRSYKARKTLNRHLRECGKEKSFSCSLCDYRAHRNDRLRSHVRIIHPESLVTS
jgi:hypothetical protein